MISFFLLRIQTVFHSILSTRIVLHITTVLKQDPIDSRSTTLVQHGHLTKMEFANSSNVSAMIVSKFQEGTANSQLV